MRFLFISFLLLGACAKTNTDKCNVSPSIDKSKPGVLVIGDSISMGYTPHLKEALPQADVIHSACNDMSSRNGLYGAAAWAGYREHWKVITFNHGMWDIAPNQQATTLEEYAQDLRAEALELRAHTDKLIFVLTTKVSPGWTAFSNNDIDERNVVASQVMADLGIEVFDLNAVSAPINNTEHDESEIHWTDYGSSVLGASLALKIATYL